MKEEKYVLGIDIGTGSVKCVILNNNGEIVSSASKKHKTSHPAPSFSEQNPEDWYEGTVETITNAIKKSNINKNKIESIGLCGTAHAPILLDNNMEVIRPAILWSDQRSEKEVEYLKDNHGEKILDITFNQPNCTWTLPQLLWLRHNEEESFKAVKHLLISKDYLIYRMTGEIATDFSTAASTLMFDYKNKKWSPYLVDISGLKLGSLPEIFNSTDVVGTLANKFSKETGLPKDIKVVAGSLDSAAELIGVGIISHSQGMIRLGSAGGLMMLTKKLQPTPGLLTYPYPISPYFYCQAGTNTCATAIQWIKSIIDNQTNINYKSNKPLSFENIDEMAQNSPPGSNGLIFHPYLLGERTPYWDSNLRGSFSGISLSHNTSDFLRAVKEGTAFSLKDCFEYSLEYGFSADDLRIGGGGVKSKIWTQIICDVLGLEAFKTNIDASPIGVALISSISAGFYSNLKEAIKKNVSKKGKITPDRKKEEIYSHNYKMYKDITKALCPIYHKYNN